MRTICIAILIAAQCFLPTLQAENSSHVLGFAEHLAENEEYYRAITEYQRFLYLFPDHAMRERVQFRIAEAHLDGGEHDTAISLFDTFISQANDTNLIAAARRRLAGGLFEAQRYQDIITLPDAEDAPPDLIALKGLAFLHAGAPDAATNLFTKAQHAGFDATTSAALRAAAHEWENLPYRSAKRAAWMSALLPGAGQLYVKRPHDAMWAFTLNATFIAAALYGFNNDEVVAGSFALAAEAVWYTGNIYNAANGAQKFNEDREREHAEVLEARLPPDTFNLIFYRTTF